MYMVAQRALGGKENMGSYKVFFFAPFIRAILSIFC